VHLGRRAQEPSGPETLPSPALRGGPLAPSLIGIKPPARGPSTSRELAPPPWLGQGTSRTALRALWVRPSFLPSRDKDSRDGGAGGLESAVQTVLRPRSEAGRQGKGWPDPWLAYLNRSNADQLVPKAS